MRYLLQGILPTNPVQREKLKKYVTRFKVVDGKLLKRCFQERWMVCILAKEVNGALSNPHQGEPARHPGGESCGKWLYTKNIIGPQCKEMLKTLQGNVKHAKGKKMKYTLAIRVFILPWLHIHSTA